MNLPAPTRPEWIEFSLEQEHHFLDHDGINDDLESVTSHESDYDDDLARFESGMLEENPADSISDDHGANGEEPLRRLLRCTERRLAAFDTDSLKLVRSKRLSCHSDHGNATTVGTEDDDSVDSLSSSSSEESEIEYEIPLGRVPMKETHPQFAASMMNSQLTFRHPSVRRFRRTAELPLLPLLPNISNSMERANRIMEDITEALWITSTIKPLSEEDGHSSAHRHKRHPGWNTHAE